MSGAGPALQRAAIEALQGAAGIGGVYDGPPLQAAFPYAVVEFGPEMDWGHKSGTGREARLAVILHDEGERPARLYRLMEEAESALRALQADGDGWHIVGFRFVRSLIASNKRGPRAGQTWSGLIEYRARMLLLAADG